MARETREQNRESGQQGQQARPPGASRSENDRERPLESGRDREGRGGMVRQRGSTPTYGGMGGPFAAMRRMAEDMDQLFEQFGFGRNGFGLTPRFVSPGADLWSDRGVQAGESLWTPQVEAFRKGDKFVVRADVPGVKKEDIHVEVENDVLTISGERREEHEEDRDGFYRSERSYGQFYRAIPLPEGVNAEQCDASFRDGVLEVTLPAPRQEERKSKRIQVR